MKTSIRLIVVCTALVFAFAIGFGIGKRRGSTWSHEGGIVEMQTNGDGILLTDSGKAVVELKPAANVYFVTAYAAEVPVLTMKFVKWEKNPVLVQRFLRSDAKTLIVSYKEDGQVAAEAEDSREE